MAMFKLSQDMSTVVNDDDLYQLLTQLPDYDCAQGWGQLMAYPMNAEVSAGSSIASPTQSGRLGSSSIPDDSMLHSPHMPNQYNPPHAPQYSEPSISHCPKRKEQNRFAQRAFRERQRRRITESEVELEKLRSVNGQLQTTNKKLESDLAGLQQEIMMHFERVHGVGGLTTSPRPVG
ncbi:hypothetical protein LTR36_006310 [Oleoguttula mirabilis]|uniref:BZIP domain-containing protein n=1 Tax=Oleoguttula mirabilis TaxID=1507867 RepID=A0AAV9JD61_9PEZI|nr:hypothetical protein LTR36_006310 [Oleoguttula mirabilis]